MMHIEPLSHHPHKIDELAQLLYEEWKDFSPWASPSLILERLKLSSLEQQFPFTCIALSLDDQLLGMASVKLRELPEETDKNHWLGEVLIRKEMRGQGIGSALIRFCIQYRRHIALSVHARPTSSLQAIWLGGCGGQIHRR
jgi:GNAT superfamily N-acetyltransferase